MKKAKTARFSQQIGREIMKSESHDQISARQKLERFVEALGHTLDSYEKAHPTWFTDTVFELIEGGLHSLRHYLEDPRDKSLTWSNLVTELRYPVEWDWEAWRSRRPGALLHIFGRFTSKEVGSKKRAIRKLVSIAIQCRNVFVLNALTKNAAWEKRRNRWTPIMPPETGQALAKMSPARQRRALDELYKPFSIGTFDLEFDADSIRQGDPVPKSVMRALAKGKQAMEFPPLTFSGTVDDTPFTFSLIAQFRPFIVDVTNREAYFPILVGLVFHPNSVALAEDEDGRALLVPDAPNPESWSRKDQAAFWDILFREWKRITKSRGASARNAVVELMVKAKIALPSGRRGLDIVNSLLKLLSQHGRVEDLECSYKELVEEQAEIGSHRARTKSADRFDVFLAHNSKDKPFVAKVADHLRRRGIKPWFDKEQIAPGCRFQKCIQNAIRNVSVAAVFIGQHGVGRWQDLELESLVKLCVDKNLPLIPVLLPGQKKLPSTLPFLDNISFVRFNKNAGEKKALDEMVWGIRDKKPAGDLGRSPPEVVP
jgi:hypothetical protein